MIKKERISMDELFYPLEERGNLEHAIRCTKQAEERASFPWLKKACAYRLKMLNAQLAKQKQNQRF